ncbi:MAG: efflux RND transporter permease subunit, partial [Myxococcota bacterium]
MSWALGRSESRPDLNSVDEFRELIVREDGGAVVRLEDIATVVLGAESYDSEVRFSGETAVFMGIFPLPDANSPDVVAAIRADLEELKSELPAQLEASVGYDATTYINDALEEVVSTLVETLLIVIFVIFLALGSLRSAFVPVVAIPVSLVGAVFLMQAFGFSLNLLTLLAIVLSVGLVVDDAIVVVENTVRHLRDGMRPVEAAIKSARELLGPVVAMTVTLAAVYAPIGLQGGLTGSLFREFALTLAGAVGISGVVALTLSPVMSASLLRAEGHDTGFTGRVNRAFDALKDRYGTLLDWTLQSRPAVYTAWVLLSLAGVMMFSQAPKELAPTEDQGVIFGIVETSSNSTLDQTVLYAEQAARAFSSTPEAATTFQLTFPTSGFGGMVLKPWTERERTSMEILPEIRDKLAAIPGIRIFPVTPPALPGGGQFPVEFVLASTAETTEILKVADQIQLAAMNSGMFAFPPTIDVKVDQPSAEIKIDREKVAQLGLNLQQVGADIAAAVGGNFVN